jgi:hypothetical protein
VDPLTSAALPLPASAGPDDLARLSDRLRTLLEAAPDRVVTCDARELDGLGLAAVDLLARLELVARRAGGRIRIRHAPPALLALLLLAGLGFEQDGGTGTGHEAGAETAPRTGTSPGVEMQRKAERGKQPGRVQERGQSDDPPP